MIGSHKWTECIIQSVINMNVSKACGLLVCLICVNCVSYAISLSHRSIYARYDRTVHMEGIELYRFVVPRDVLASAKENPDNRAFCTPNCLDTGVINITRCKDG